MSRDASPALSICIPAYARPNELRLAIESVVTQDLEDLEVVIGDDSGDLEPVVGEFGDSRIRYFRNPERLGMAGNWNSVLDRATGRHLGLLMDDDRLLQGFAREVVTRLDSDPSVGVAFTNHYFDDGRALRRRRSLLAEGRHDDFLHDLLVCRPVPISAAVMRRQIWVETRPLPDLLTADLVLHIRIALAGWAFHYIDEPLMAYGVHAGQLSSHEDRFRDDGVRAWELFEFPQESCERLRRRHLARGLVSRAATHIKRGRFGPAIEDLTRAARLDPNVSRGKAGALRFLAGHPLLVPIALRAWNGLRRSNAESGGHASTS